MRLCTSVARCSKRLISSAAPLAEYFLITFMLLSYTYWLFACKSIIPLESQDLIGYQRSGA